MGEQDGSNPASEPPPLSAERLRAAFKRMLAPPSSVSEHPSDSTAEAATTPEGILEALLFTQRRDAGGLAFEEVAERIHGVSATDLRQAADKLNALYEAGDSGLRIDRTADHAAMTIAAGCEPVAQRFTRAPSAIRIAGPTLATLAVVAYRQPISAAQASEIGGESTRSRLRQLQRYGLIRPRRPDPDASEPRYETTDRFLRAAGINRLEDLPPAGELTE